MKPQIHPQYFEAATITCACGATYQTGSTKESTSVELCAACHPFYTGTQTLVDTARRVEKFQERISKKEITAESRVGRATKRVSRAEKRLAAGPKVEVVESRTGRIIKKTLRVTKK